MVLLKKAVLGAAAGCPSVAVHLELMAGNIQYVSDENGTPTSVIVPIELWREIESERETAYLLKSEAMRRRLAEARSRQDGIPLKDVCEKLGI